MHASNLKINIHVIWGPAFPYQVRECRDDEQKRDEQKSNTDKFLQKHKLQILDLIFP
jgi:hypothetical protein